MNLLKKNNLKLHFVGIGGIGMSGIAEVFFNQGFLVTGSDAIASETTKRLQELGIAISIGHSDQQIEGSSVIIYSSAIKPDNPAIIAAKKLRIPVISRAEMLGELMRGKVAIGIAGSHGKTTTTSMLAMIISDADLDPTIVIGGKVDALGGNAKLGQGLYVVAETDESDGSFLHLPLTYGVITNIDNDHLDHFKTYEQLQNSFLQFVKHLPFYGKAFVCAEDPGVFALLELFSKPYMTYGLSEGCDYWATDIQLIGVKTYFTVYQKNLKLGQIELQVPGVHNVLNALAAISVARELEIPFTIISQALKNFFGVKRRFEIRIDCKQTARVLIDDYAHHPTELAVTFKSIKNYWSGKKIIIFQPHRYSRTQFCYEQFLDVLDDDFEVFLMDIYPAGEKPLLDITSQKLARDLQNKGAKVTYTGDFNNTFRVAQSAWAPGTCLALLGAGSIVKVTDALVKENTRQRAII